MNKIILNMKDPVSGLTHLFGFFASILGIILLIVHADTTWQVVTFSIFGSSLIMLYLASSIYHLLPLGEKGSLILRKLDHMMIFVLVAGTYTPICLIPLRGGWGWTLFGIIWGFVLAGVLMKLFWMNAPRWISTLMYVVMGWMIVIAIYPLIQVLPLEAVILLVTGGVLYTTGAVVYAVQWPRFTNRWFGFHEIFHLFVLAGSFAHFLMVYLYI